MEKFPDPPSQRALSELDPDVYVLQPGVTLWRIFRRGGAYPTAWDQFRYWGPVSTARFDHHLPPPRLQGRGMLYAATQVITTVAEVFQDGRSIDVALGEPWLVGFRLEEPVALLNLTGEWPTAAGASMNMTPSAARARARRWARAIYGAYPQLGGLWYGSSMHANTPCAALFERAEHLMPDAPRVLLPLSDPHLGGDLRSFAHRLNYRLILPARSHH